MMGMGECLPPRRTEGLADFLLFNSKCEWRFMTCVGEPADGALGIHQRQFFHPQHMHDEIIATLASTQPRTSPRIQH